MKRLLGTFGAVLLAGASINAQIIADWTFETSVPAGSPGAGVWFTNIAPEVGSGAASGLHAGAATYSTPVGDGSAHSFSSSTWAVNDLYQFATATVNVLPGVKVEWDQTGSSTGPAIFKLQYSTDGTSFTTFGSDYTVLINGSPNPAWSSLSYASVYHYAVDLSSITALNNSSVWFRLVDDSTTSTSGGTVGTGGTGRVDNFVVEVVPEPGALALLGFSMASLLVFRRR